MRLLLLGAFIGAATVWYLVARRWPRPEDFDRMSPEAFNAFIERVGLDAGILRARAETAGDRDVRTDALSDLNGYPDGATWESIRGHIHE